MSGICGFVGPGDPRAVDAMLAAIDYRGDATAVESVDGCTLGYRWWRGRPGKSPGVFKSGDDLVVCAGTLAPPHANPAQEIHRILSQRDETALNALDGAFGAAWWSAKDRALTLIRDPFGVRSLYFTTIGPVTWFATELKQLLAIPGFSVEVDHSVIHKYLTFSFVPGKAVPIKNVERLLPGHILQFKDGRKEGRAYFVLKEELDPKYSVRREAVRTIRQLGVKAVRNRLNGESKVGVYLSGGLDSSSVLVWLREAGVDAHAFSLDFGDQSVEHEQAKEVAEKLGVRQTWIRMDGSELSPLLMDLVWKLDLPFGDAVTGPQFLLGKAAREAGMNAVFNGEGGDQLFGGWTSKPMIAAELYADLYEDDSREEMYLRSYHRFYGLEDQLYTPDFKNTVGGPGQRRALLKPYLATDRAATFLNRVRLADISLKGSQNILPRAERMANAWALDARVPLFDRALAEASFSLPPALKLNAACEKYVLKLAMQTKLPPSIVWRRKFGMSVPMTDWLMGSLKPVAHDLVGPASLKKRGWFQTSLVNGLLEGRDDPLETRKRRVGEKLWALIMLEAWLRIFVDGKGKRPGAT